jgi:hypothetical protein
VVCYHGRTTKSTRGEREEEGRAGEVSALLNVSQSPC